MIPLKETIRAICKSQNVVSSITALPYNSLFVNHQIFTSIKYNNINEFSLTKIYLNFNFFGIFKKIQEIIPFPCNEGQFATESDVGGKE